MGVFEDVKYTWRGQEYVIPADDVMAAVRAVEHIITLKEITTQMTTGKVINSQVADAYTELLQRAGCTTITQPEIYAELFDPQKDSPLSKQAALSGLLMLMVPPVTLRKALNNEAEKLAKLQKEAGVTTGEKKPTTTRNERRQSKKRTRSRSAKAGSQEQSSGNSTQPNSGG